MYVSFLCTISVSQLTPAGNPVLTGVDPPLALSLQLLSPSDIATPIIGFGTGKANLGPSSFEAQNSSALILWPA